MEQEVRNEVHTPLEDWLSGEIVEDMLDISKRTLQTLRSEKRIGFAKIGRKCYYKRADIEQFIEQNYNPSEL